MVAGREIKIFLSLNENFKYPFVSHTFRRPCPINELILILFSTLNQSHSSFISLSQNNIVFFMHSKWFHNFFASRAPIFYPFFVFVRWWLSVYSGECIRVELPQCMQVVAGYSAASNFKKSATSVRENTHYVMFSAYFLCVVWKKGRKRNFCFMFLWDRGINDIIKTFLCDYIKNNWT